MMGLGKAALLLALASAFPAAAQLHVERFGAADGLPDDQVLSLCEDRHGLIWIGTVAGLARHDGMRLRTFHHDRKDPHSLPNDGVWDLLRDTRDRMWAATDHGVCMYEEQLDRFHRCFVTQPYTDLTTANRIHRMVDDGRGRMWLATEDGLHRIASAAPFNYIPFENTAQVPLALRRRLDTYGLKLDPRHQGIWINASDGVYFFDLKEDRFVTPSEELSPPFTVLSRPAVQDVVPDGKGGIWYFDMEALSVVHLSADGGNERRFPTPATDRRPGTCQRLAMDSDGRIWLGTWNRQLAWLDPATGDWHPQHATPDLPWGLRSTNMKAWLQDRRGRIWLGTFRGLHMYDPTTLDPTPIQVGTGPDAPEVTALTALADGSFLASAGRTLYLYPPTAKQPTASWDIGRITSWTTDSEGLLLGGFGKVFRFDSLAREQQLIFELPDGANERITAITREGPYIWVGTWSQGLFRIGPDGEVKKFAEVAGDALPRNEVLSMAACDQGIWVGLNNGAGALLMREGRIVERTLHGADSLGLSYGVVTALACGPDGRLYLGTLMGGVGVQERDGSFSWYTRSDGLPNDRVEQLLLHGGSLWVRTSHGLARLDPDDGTITVVRFPPSLQVLGPVEAIAPGPAGMVRVAIANVVLSVTQGRSVAVPPPPPLVLHAHAGGHRAAFPQPDSALTLTPDHPVLALDLGVPYALASEAIRFIYRLSGPDTAWIDLEKSDHLELRQLPPGDHTVELRTVLGNGSRSERATIIPLRVLPAFWSRWWFQLGLAAALLLVGGLIVRTQLQRRMAVQRAGFEREQAVVSERMRIASDMHDDLGAGLSALKLRSEMALRVEQDGSKRAHLGELAETAGELMNSMRQIIWTMNDEHGTLDDLVAYTMHYVRQTAADHGLVAQVDVDAQRPPLLLTAVQRRNIFLVVKEALHNVVKHAQATTVNVAMHLRGGTLVAEIRDDGRGLPADAADGMGNGLRNMRKRVTDLGGTFGMSAPATGGTLIQFEVPLPNERSISGTSNTTNLRT